MGDWHPDGYRLNAMPIESFIPPLAAQLSGRVYTTFPLAANTGIPPHEHVERLQELGFPLDPNEHAIRLPDDETGRARWTTWIAMQDTSYSRYGQRLHAASRSWQSRRLLWQQNEGQRIGREIEARRQAAAAEAARMREEQRRVEAESDQTEPQPSNSTQSPSVPTVGPPSGDAIDASYTTQPAFPTANRTDNEDSPDINTASQVPHTMQQPRSGRPRSNQARVAGEGKGLPTFLAADSTAASVSGITTRCTACAKSKKGCDGGRPCGRCAKAGRTYEQCVPQYREQDRKVLRDLGMPDTPQAEPPAKKQRLDTSIGNEDSTSSATIVAAGSLTLSNPLPRDQQPSSQSGSRIAGGGQDTRGQALSRGATFPFVPLLRDNASLGLESTPASSRMGDDRPVLPEDWRVDRPSDNKASQMNQEEEDDGEEEIQE